MKAAAGFNMKKRTYPSLTIEGSIFRYLAIPLHTPQIIASSLSL